MIAETLTTKEVARLCRVSDATVKRWEESGLISSERTNGGHRRFRVEEIARFQRDRNLGSKHCHGDEGVMNATSRRRLNKTHSSCNFFHAAVAGCEQESANILINKFLNGTPLPKIFDSLVSSAIARVCELRTQGELNTAQKHLAIRTTISALYKFRNMLPVSDSNRKLAVCSTIDGDFYDLPTYMTQITLENHGFEVINFGADIPFHCLLEEVMYYSPSLISIAAATVGEIDRISGEYKEFRRKISKFGIPVIFSGKALELRNMIRRFPAEVYARTFGDLDEFLNHQ